MGCAPVNPHTMKNGKPRQHTSEESTNVFNSASSKILLPKHSRRFCFGGFIENRAVNMLSDRNDVRPTTRNDRRCRAVRTRMQANILNPVWKCSRNFVRETRSNERGEPGPEPQKRGLFWLSKMSSYFWPNFYFIPYHMCR